MTTTHGNPAKHAPAASGSPPRAWSPARLVLAAYTALAEQMLHERVGVMLWRPLQ
jgi:hypothetical protein